MTKITFTVERDFDECKDCTHNLKNMTWKQRLKKLWEEEITYRHYPTICGMCTAEKIINRFKNNGKKNTKRNH